MLTTPKRDTRPVTTSRRQMIFNMAIGVGAVGAISVVPRPAAAAKLSQSDSGYQNRPNGSQRCDLCANWMAPTSCKFVAGNISPSGWCSLFAARKS